MLCLHSEFSLSNDGDLIAAFHCIKTSSKKESFYKVCTDRIKGNDFQQKEDRFRKNIRKKLSAVGVLRHWNQ